MPSSFSARTMRTAISPRLATRTLSNMWAEAYLAQGFRRGVVGTGMRSYVVSAVLLACLALAAPSPGGPVQERQRVRGGHAARGRRRHRRALQPRRPHDVRHERDGPGDLRRQHARRSPSASAACRCRTSRTRTSTSAHRRRDYVIITNDPSFSGVGVDLRHRRDRPARARAASVTPTEVPGSTTSPGRRGSSNGHIANCVAGLPATCGRPAARGPHRLRPPRPAAPEAPQARSSRARRRLHPRRPHRRVRHRVGHRRGRHVRLRRDATR